jgi:hypothetical protein
MLKRLVDASLLWPSLLCTALVIGGCHHDGPEPDGGTVDLSVEPDLASPADLACNPTDPGCTPADMKNPGDMHVPPGDMPPPGDMNTPGDMPPPGDMTMPGDMTTPGDMTMTGDMPSPGDMTMPGDMTSRDMTSPGDMTTPVDMTTPRDMTSPGDMTSGTAGIGDPCTADSECKVGSMPTCWKTNVLNNTANPATPSGYCSAKCTAETDCGSGAHCVGIGSDKYCLKACSDATTCRHPGYACAFIAGGTCYPDTIYDCDPKSTGGTCTESGTSKPGGCLRQAFEDKGSCSASCTVGAGTCATTSSGVKRQCIYYDMTRDGYSDTYQGLICVQSPATPKADNAACTFLNECADGSECDGIDGKCHVMCGKGGTPACTTGMCQDDLFTPASGPGLCR